jgi:hypothetical protein
MTKTTTTIRFHIKFVLTVNRLRVLDALGGVASNGFCCSFYFHGGTATSGHADAVERTSANRIITGRAGRNTCAVVQVIGILTLVASTNLGSIQSARIAVGRAVAGSTCDVVDTVSTVADVRHIQAIAIEQSSSNRLVRRRACVDARSVGSQVERILAHRAVSSNSVHRVAGVTVR